MPSIASLGTQEHRRPDVATVSLPGTGTTFNPVTPLHPIPDGRVHLLGAVHCVTGATTRVEAGRGVLVVDCGIAQGREAVDWQLPDGVVDAHAIALTHGHIDHVGGVPVRRLPLVLTWRRGLTACSTPPRWRASTLRRHTR